MKKKAATGSAGEDATREAGFVFRGTVQRLKASTMPEVKPDDRTAVVRVDEVLRAPQALAGWGGKEITVQLGGRKKVAAGGQAVFYTNGWRFGESIAVQSVAHEPVTAAPATGPLTLAAAAAPLAAPSAGAAGPVQNREDQNLKDNVAKADLIVAGRVSAVRLADDTARQAGAATATGLAMAAGAAAAPPPPRQRISEHDAIWQEAVIDVASVEKGAARERQVVVRFPGSNDVRWHNHPKFRPGEEGVFLLQQGTPAAPARALAGDALAMAPAAGEPAVPGGLQAVGNPQPMSALGTIRTLLGNG